MPLRLLVASLVLLVAAAAAAQDTIYLKDGTTIPGAKAAQKIQVTEETIQQVGYKIVGIAAPQGIAAAKVDRVEYGEKCKEYDDAMTALHRGAYDEAVEKFSKAAELAEPTWAKPYSLFQIAETHRLSGKWDTAIAAYNKLAAQLPKSRFVPEARLAVATCQLAKGDVGAAKASLSKLKEEAASKGFAETFVNRASFWEIRIIEQIDKNYAEAVTKYGALAAKVEKDDLPLASECKLRIGGCYALQGDYKKALDFYKAIVDSAAVQRKELVAGARLGLGNVLLMQKDFPAARWEFLRVIVLDDNSPGEIPDDIAAGALYGAAQCFQQLRDKEPEAESRASKLLRELIRKFPGTEYAARAKQRGK
jgi:outer membrane protein assembly factor BamD (BamD/ComL family)